MPKQFTDADTEKYYNTVEIQYEIPWNQDGSKHWGYFENLDAPDEEKELFRASDRWNDYMLDTSAIAADSRVLEIGCGNGNAAIYLAQKTGCEVAGIDISETHISNSQAKAADFPSLRLSFHKASATELPFPDNSFTHVWSQGTLLHIHERDLALKEAYRVLKKDGVLIFDDLVALVPAFSESTLKYVMERMRLSELFSPQSYESSLGQLGFEILESKDLNLHLQKTYAIQSLRVREQDPERSLAYEKTGAAVAAGEIGWWFCHCQKVV
ncbi:MAG: class I SAM-dependent methyltransferase [Oscillatoria sp. SIO1A7]|nr:class I SAM-dependent methyltransferase [Oscillatoria sp. SIO1A7]